MALQTAQRADIEPEHKDEDTELIYMNYLSAIKEKGIFCSEDLKDNHCHIFFVKGGQGSENNCTSSNK